MRRRTSAVLVADQVDAIVRCPLIHRMGNAISESQVGRPRLHPLAAHLGFGALIRVWRSGARLDAELPTMWPAFVAGFNDTAEELGTEPIGPRAEPIAWHHYRRGRDRMIQNDNLGLVAETFTLEALTIARGLGLLLPNGPGSLTYPHPTRTIYGDGTIVRPIYRTTRELGDDPDTPGRRTDPDAADHVRHDGTVSGTNFVAVCARGPGLRERVVLRAARVPAPGQEAATALAAIADVHRLAGAGIQAVAYDGAFTGVHIEQLMTTCGLVVVNKVASAPTTADEKAAGTRNVKQYPLGVHTHRVGRRECRHNLICHDGAVHQLDLDDSGEADLSEPLRRVQVKRTRRRNGYRFTIGVEIACRHGHFTTWLSPHPRTDETHNRRPENIRLLPQADPYFQTVYGLRNDSESLNSGFKRTLLVERAMSLGWQRQLLDFYAYAILTNSVAWSEGQQRAQDTPALRAVS